ncbi:MAG TPA: hypothetical protein VFX65_05420 [Candidatus Limnocylindrales bacterium]|nr:hypothetical protein [Candidatus Limnocylindrales bacterium]
MTPPREDPGVVDLGAAARRVLEDDGRTFVLQPWQVAYCVALSEGRPAVVPPGCGVGKGWLDARLRAALAGIGQFGSSDGSGG